MNNMKVKLIIICEILILAIIVSMVSIPRINNIGKEYVEFNSTIELKVWLKLDDTNTLEYINNTFDCDDFAMRLVDNARESGYKIYIFADYDANHCICVTKINNIWYIIEPQTDYITGYCKEL